MLKQPASFVLVPFRPSTHPCGYALDLHSLQPCRTSCLSILRYRAQLAKACAPLRRQQANMVSPILLAKSPSQDVQ